MKHLKGLTPGTGIGNWIKEAGIYIMTLVSAKEMNDRMNDETGKELKTRQYEDVTEQLMLEFVSEDGEHLKQREHLRGFVTVDQHKSIDWGRYKGRIEQLDVDYDRKLCVIQLKKGEKRPMVRDGHCIASDEIAHVNGTYRITDTAKTEQALSLLGQLYQAVGEPFDGETLLEDLASIASSGMTMSVKVEEGERTSKNGNPLMEIKSISAVRSNKVEKPAPRRRVTEDEDAFYEEDEAPAPKSRRKVIA